MEAGSTLIEIGRYAEAEAVLAPGLADAEAALAFDTADREARRMVRILTMSLAQAGNFQGRIAEGVATLRRVLHDDERQLATDPRNPRNARDVAYDHTVIGEALDRSGDRRAACAQDKVALDRMAELDRAGIFSNFDLTGNVALVRERIARNCR